MAFLLLELTPALAKPSLPEPIAGLEPAGRRVGVMKPFASGCRRDGDTVVPADALFLQEHGCEARTDLALICPYAFERPLAPGIAARSDTRSRSTLKSTEDIQAS